MIFFDEYKRKKRLKREGGGIMNRFNDEQSLTTNTK